MPDLRDEFEAWARSEKWLCDRNSFGEYIYETTRDGWHAYQAATERAAKKEREDTERLDHLQSTGSTVEILPAGLSYKFRIGGLRAAVSHNIRNAIDAAMKGGQ